MNKAMSALNGNEKKKKGNRRSSEGFEQQKCS